MSQSTRYGPSLLAIAAALVALWATPVVARRWATEQARATSEAAHHQLEGGSILDAINQANRLVAEAVEPSVVYVSTRTDGATFASTTGGSGWIWDDLGHVVTNAHVVEGASRIEVQVATGQTLRAELVGLDLHTDVAVLSIDPPDLPAAARQSALPKQGEVVFAFGSPFDFRFSVSSGVVSGVGRSADIPDMEYENFIQVDAAVNPGNSGGPLVDARGRVIGMNTAIATGRGNTLGQRQFAGVALAIPVSIVENVVGQLLESGRVEAGYLGIRTTRPGFFGRHGEETLVAAIRSAAPPGGAIVDEVMPDSPAAAGGLQRGDVILSVNAAPVTDDAHLTSLIATCRPGTDVHLGLWRAFGPLGLAVDAPEGPGSFELTVVLAQREATVQREITISLLQSAGVLRLAESAEGVRIESLAAVGHLPDAVHNGAIIVTVDGAAVRTLDDLYTRIERHLAHAATKGDLSPVRLGVRTGTAAPVEVPIPIGPLRFGP